MGPLLCLGHTLCQPLRESAPWWVVWARLPTGSHVQAPTLHCCLQRGPQLTRRWVTCSRKVGRVLCGRLLPAVCMRGCVHLFTSRNCTEVSSHSSCCWEAAAPSDSPPRCSRGRWGPVQRVPRHTVSRVALCICTAPAKALPKFVCSKIPLVGFSGT